MHVLETAVPRYPEVEQISFLSMEQIIDIQITLPSWNLTYVSFRYTMVSVRSFAQLSAASGISRLTIIHDILEVIHLTTSPPLLIFASINVFIFYPVPKCFLSSQKNLTLLYILAKKLEFI